MTDPTPPPTLDADAVDRTVLLALRTGWHPTLEDAEAAHDRTGIVLHADTTTCAEVAGQAALLTAVVTAARALGTVQVVVAAPDAPILGGLHRGRSLAEACDREGAVVASAAAVHAHTTWPTVLLGETDLDGLARAHEPGPVLRASWNGWTARVTPGSAPSPAASDSTCVLAAATAGALAVHEVFGMVLGRAGSDVGYRSYDLNLWEPGATTDRGPDLAYAPASWWLVGLGHLGQAYAWVLSWLLYTDPGAVQVVLQDTDRTTPANHSTGVLTPTGSTGVRKTRLVAAALDAVGFDTTIIERRLDATQRVTLADAHVALLGVDNLPTRLLTSTVGWPLAIDIGLGADAASFDSLLMYRFPGGRRSESVSGWTTQPTATAPIEVPRTAAFRDLENRFEQCGVVELAGKAVGASFVGVIAACIAVAEACRGLHGGAGFDVLALDLNDHAAQTTTATDRAGCPASAPLRCTSRAAPPTP